MVKTTTANKVTTAIIPIAWDGTRVIEATKATTKAMLNIYDKPALAHLLQECKQAWIQKVILVINKSDLAHIKKYLWPNESLNKKLKSKGKLRELELIKDCQLWMKVQFTFQEESLGDWDAILQWIKWGEYNWWIKQEDSVAVLFWDDLVFRWKGKNALEQIIYQHQHKRTSVLSLVEVPKEDTHKYWIVDMDEKSKVIKNFIEKPKQGTTLSNLSVIGKYIITPNLIDILKQGVKPTTSDWEVRLADAIIENINEWWEIHWKPLRGIRCDTGNYDWILKASFARKVTKDSSPSDKELETYEKLLNL